MLIAMAGLPGTGKSTLAARLADALGGVVLSKDVVRAAMFPAPVLDYSSAQDEVAMSAVYAAASHILKTHPTAPVFLDGRTFSKPGQLDAPIALAQTLGVPLRVIECVCADEVACARIAGDQGLKLSAPRDRQRQTFRHQLPSLRRQSRQITLPPLLKTPNRRLRRRQPGPPFPRGTAARVRGHGRSRGHRGPRGSHATCPFCGDGHLGRRRHHQRWAGPPPTPLPNPERANRGTDYSGPDRFPKSINHGASLKPRQKPRKFKDGP